MKTMAVPLVAVLTASLLAGCAYEPEAKVVDFSAVDASQPGARFELQVKVVGLHNGSTPLVGAFVGAAEGDQAIAKGTSDENGIATLRVQTGQTIRVVASAPGWTTEDSGRLKIGARSSDTQEGFGASCAGGAAQDSGNQAAGGWCTVTAGSDETTTFTLDGDRGAVSVVLFPKQVRQVFTREIGPNAYAQFTTLPDGERWIQFTAPVQEDAQLHDLQMLRLQNATTTMSWENDMFSQADFELGAGCRENAPEEQTDELVPTVRTQGPVELVVEYAAGEDGRWSSCTHYYAGPIVSSGNLPVEVTVVNELTFRGRSTIIPIQ